MMLNTEQLHWRSSFSVSLDPEPSLTAWLSGWNAFCTARLSLSRTPSFAEFFFFYCFASKQEVAHREGLMVSDTFQWKKEQKKKLCWIINYFFISRNADASAAFLASTSAVWKWDGSLWLRSHIHRRDKIWSKVLFLKLTLVQILISRLMQCGSLTFQWNVLQCLKISHFVYEEESWTDFCDFTWL